MACAGLGPVAPVRFGPGHTIIDVGCGPGFASLDLAELVCPSGRIVAVDQSARYLHALAARCAQRGVTNVAAHQLDLDATRLPATGVDGATCRWVLTFVKQPHDVVRALADALRPGGAVAVHEYFDYGTSRTSPRCVELEER
jgi:ubiquinone/menaquinone biosynthesis C-methylase UbiE